MLLAIGVSDMLDGYVARRFQLASPAGALFDAAAISEKDSNEQREKFSYFADSSREGNEREMFRKMLELDAMGLGEYMVLPVHDEIIFDVPDEEVDAVCGTIMKHMPDTESFSVPLTVGVETASRWGDKYE